MAESFAELRSIVMWKAQFVSGEFVYVAKEIPSKVFQVCLVSPCCL